VVKKYQQESLNMCLPPLCRVAFCSVALGVLLSAGLLLAQNSTGTISGRVIDPTAAAVAGAEVRAINQVDKTLTAGC
jgi:L-lactate permease